LLNYFLHFKTEKIDSVDGLPSLKILYFNFLQITTEFSVLNCKSLFLLPVFMVHFNYGNLRILIVGHHLALVIIQKKIIKKVYKYDSDE
jgi:hypothetical protein